MVSAPNDDAIAGEGGIRNVVARWVITGSLILESPAHLGNGEEALDMDMPVMLDKQCGLPLLTGSSLAGAMRSYLLDVLKGYRVAETQVGNEDPSAVRIEGLMGGRRGDDEGGQSPLIVFDCLGAFPRDFSGTELRDAVQLNPERGTAEDRLKFQIELLPRWTQFPLRLDLLIEDHSSEAEQLGTLLRALQGLQSAEIPIGARKSRGLGACRARRWRARRLDLTRRADWEDWLQARPNDIEALIGEAIAFNRVEEAVREAWAGRVKLPTKDMRLGQRVRVVLDLRAKGGLLIGSSSTDPRGPDSVHLNWLGASVLTGSGVVGALRSRALRIAHVVREGYGDADEWVASIFGSPPSERSAASLPSASRLRTNESLLSGGSRLQPTRIRVDRFTGGVVDGYLFDEEPDYGSRAYINLELIQPSHIAEEVPRARAEVGLLLLLCKDLLTGDVALGGTASVGRGIFEGKATLYWRNEALSFDNDGADNPETVRRLNECVAAFRSVGRINHE